MIDKLGDNLKSPIAMAVAISIAVIAFILAVPSAIGVSYFVTSQQIHSNTLKIEQVQREAIVKAADLERQNKVRAARVEIAAAIPQCRTLRTLADIKGSHGDSKATYGVHLQAGIKALYADGACPKILAGKYRISSQGVVTFTK